MSEIFCPFCGSKCTTNMRFCAACGSELPKIDANKQIINDYPTQFQQSQVPSYQATSISPVQQPSYPISENQQNLPDYAFTPTPAKDRFLTAILALILGDIGVHKFYLGKIGQGLLYLAFCWTGIPAIIGIIEGIIYLLSTDEEFRLKYVRR